MRIKFLLCSSILFSSFAGEVVQTDWSGGPGVPGPVTDFMDCYYMGLNMEYSSPGGLLTLVNEPAQYLIGEYFNGACSICTADLDGDGDPDVIGAAKHSDQVSCWINRNGGSASWTKVILSSDFNGAESVCAADLDQDGDMDVAGTSLWENRIQVWLNCEVNTWIPVTVDSTFEYAKSISSADFDGDGDNDLVCSSLEAHLLSWYENADGVATAWIEHAIDDSHEVSFVHAADVDGDGDADIFAACWAQGRISWWENKDSTGTEWQEHLVGDDFGEASGVVGCDVDSDGDMDCVGSSRYRNKVRWWENTDGTGSTWEGHDVCDYLNRAYSVHAGDIDGDGDMDIAGTSVSINMVCWYENLSGDGLAWLEHLLDEQASSPASVFCSDLNGDGISEILVAEFSSGDVCWWSSAYYPFSTGYATSSILNMQEEPQWLAVDWNSLEPSGTETVFQFRTGSNPANLGYWTEYMYEPCEISSIVSPGDTLFQYRVRFFTGDSLSSPHLDDFLVSWDPDGCGGPEDVYPELRLNANPVSSGGSFFLQIGSPEAADLNLTVRDLTGRIVSSGEYRCEAGQSALELEAPAPGLFFISAELDGFRFTRRLVVVR